MPVVKELKLLMKPIFAGAEPLRISLFAMVHTVRIGFKTKKAQR
jgi:hypothetical protein